MKRLSWKYIAGFVDGEGCLDFQASHHKSYPDTPYIRPRIRIALAENSLFVLKILHENHGGSVWQAKRGKKNTAWSDAYYWHLDGKKARPFLQNIVNHLEIKKEQAKLLIWMIDSVMGKHVENELREHLKTELKAMKRDPQRLSETAIRKAREIFDRNVEAKVCGICGKLMRWHSNRDSHKACEQIDAIV